MKYLKNCEIVDVSSTIITNNGASKLSNCYKLYLGETSITRHVIEKIKNCTYLDLSGCGISPKYTKLYDNIYIEEAPWNYSST